MSFWSGLAVSGMFTVLGMVMAGRWTRERIAVAPTAITVGVSGMIGAIVAAPHAAWTATLRDTVLLAAMATVVLVNLETALIPNRLLLMFVALWAVAQLLPGRALLFSAQGALIGFGATLALELTASLLLCIGAGLVVLALGLARWWRACPADAQ